MNKQYTTAQWQLNKSKFDSLPVGSFVKLTPDGEEGIIYSVKKKDTEFVGYVEHFIYISPSNRDEGDWTMRIGHMDEDATRLRILARAPAGLY